MWIKLKNKKGETTPNSNKISIKIGNSTKDVTVDTYKSQKGNIQLYSYKIKNLNNTGK